MNELAVRGFTAAQKEETPGVVLGTTAGREYRANLCLRSIALKGRKIKL